MKTLKKFVCDIGLVVDDTQKFKEYLSKIEAAFQEKIATGVMPIEKANGENHYNLNVDACCNYKIFKDGDKLFIKIALTNVLDYVIFVMEEDRVCMVDSITLDNVSAKTLTLEYNTFQRALHLNNFETALDVNEENIDLVRNGELPDLPGQLNITRNRYPVMPQKSNKPSTSLGRLLIRKAYSDKENDF